MKLPELFQSIFTHKKTNKEAYVSLYLDTHQVAGAFFTLKGDAAITLLASDHIVLPVDSWEARSSAVDQLLGALEEKTGHTDVTKAILGLPSTYLTPTGEIQKEVRLSIKKLTTDLELEAIGFVPLQQAIIHKMRQDEGIPPSVILLGINEHTIAVGIYKVGEIAGVRDIEKHEDIVQCVEQGLRSFSDIEVLPARMLLYGSNPDELEEIKSKLLKYQWTNKVQFLHFPKIETISYTVIVESLSLAGASELGATMGEVEEDVREESVQAETVAPVTDVTVEKTADVEKESEEIHTAVADSTPEEAIEKNEHVSEEVLEAEEAISEDFSIDDTVTPNDANVVMVDAESLGFKKDVDVLEETEIETDDDEEEEEIEEERGGMKLPAVNFSGIQSSLSRIFSGKTNIIGIIVLVVVVLGAIFGTLYWFLPHSLVTVLEIPKSFDTTQIITIDPTATIVDAEHSIIPGKKREKATSGEKTISVNGKKSIGDPAKGTVTIYNKALSSKTFKKGAVVSSGSLSFTLDEDVQVASASESIGSITFGKGDVRVTASSIGAQSNLAANSEFSFKEVSTGTAIARNDKAFAGGTSREVTVVSRTDYDSFVKEVAEDLVSKSKQELAQSVTESEKLIDSTIKTTVTEKVFDQEIDEEAKQLHGKLTINIAGIAYSEADVRALLSTVSSENIPQGYQLNDTKTTITVSDVLVKKDGKITAKALMHAVALPTVDTGSIQKELAGKSMKKAQEYLRSLPGIGGVEMSFTYSPTQQFLPINKKNISISISYLE